MTAKLKLTLNLYWAFFLSFVLTICFVDRWIARSAYFTQNPNIMSLAITIDIAVVIPVLYYFLVLRKKQAPIITLIPAIVVSLVIAGFVLPSTQQTYLHWIKKLLPALELIVLAFVLSKFRTIVQNFHAAKQSEIYFTDALAVSVKQALGNLPGLGIILTEFSLLYFAFGGWFKQFVNRNANHIPFSYHRKSGYAAILGALSMVIISETIALHLLLQHWSLLAAWILTGLSIYTFFWLLGDYQAMRLHPIILGQELLYLRIGLRWQAVIPLTEIAGIQKFNWRERKADDCLHLSVFGDPRLVIHCKRTVLAKGLFGIKRKVNRIGLSVDDEKLFLEELNKRVETGVRSIS